MRPSASLGTRLNKIFNLVSNIQQNSLYNCIWDCCCDHGYLGIKILREDLCDKLIFVDQVAHIMQGLASRLKPFKSVKHELITANAGEISLPDNMRHLVILAGVGGERTVDIVNSIESNNPDVNVDYIFCPSTSQQALRAYLSPKPFGLIDEYLVGENNRFYEILYVRNNCTDLALPQVSLNCEIWDDFNPDHQRYLSKLKKHEKQKELANKFKQF